MKTYRPYTFDGKNISCYTMEKPDGEEYMINKQISFDEWDLVFDKELYESDLLKWQQSKITVPLNLESLREILIWIYDNKCILDENGLIFNISRLADRIVIEKKYDWKYENITNCYIDSHSKGCKCGIVYIYNLLPVKSKDLYYIQNENYCGNALFWWCANSNGYTIDIRKAGKFTKETALKLATREEDTIYPCKYIDNLLEAQKLIIDCQFVKTSFKLNKTT